MARRAYGSGTIGRRKDGLYVGRAYAGWTDEGTRRRVVVSARTWTACESKLKAKLREIDRDGPGGAGMGRVTVKAWSTIWLAGHATRVRPKTYATDASAVKRWIIPTIGHRRLAELTPGDVRALRDAITKAGRTTTTALHAHTVLVAMLRAAILEGHRVPDRVLLTPRPARAVNDRAAIPVEDALRLLAVSSSRSDGARWVAALLQGMRQAEVLGLTWAAVDLQNATVDVSWQLQSLPYLIAHDRSSGFRVPDGFEARHLTGAYHLTRPKTAKGQRIIPLVRWMTSALLDVRESWQRNPWDLIWTGLDRRGGAEKVTPARVDDDRQAWVELQRTARVAHPSGRPYRLHEARHTTATLLLEAGVDPRVIRDILGQSSEAVMREYQHVSTQLAREALDLVAGRLKLTDR